MAQADSEDSGSPVMNGQLLVIYDVKQRVDRAGMRFYACLRARDLRRLRHVCTAFIYLVPTGCPSLTQRSVCSLYGPPVSMWKCCRSSRLRPTWMAPSSCFDKVVKYYTCFFSQTLLAGDALEGPPQASLAVGYFKWDSILIS